MAIFVGLLVNNILSLISHLLLYRQLQERLKRYGVTVSRPDSQTQVVHIPVPIIVLSRYRSKAVADGAIGFFCDHHVSARMSKFMYGVEYLREYDQNNQDHVSRTDRLCELPSGPKLLPDAFDCILARVSDNCPS